MALPIALIDAFTSKPFAGNPAGVCLLEHEMSADWMQQVAAEMNQNETAFLVKHDDHYGLRWFTPAVEVDLCGHATLASAHLLYTEGYVDRTLPIHFDTRSGRLTATLATYNGQEYIALDFPAIENEPISPTEDIAAVLGADPIAIYRGRFDYLVELESEAIVRELDPDLRAVATLKARGIVVTSLADESNEHDYVMRGFFPQSGIDEDSVTGSAHCMLAPFWGTRLGKTNMLGYQASPRGGYVRVDIQGDRVHLLGNAVTILKGELHV